MDRQTDTKHIPTHTSLIFHANTFWVGAHFSNGGVLFEAKNKRKVYLVRMTNMIENTI